MGYYSDPDTLSFAAAQGAANRSGSQPDSAAWWRAFRAAYRPAGRVEGNEYLKSLDDRIHALEERERLVAGPA